MHRNVQMHRKMYKHVEKSMYIDVVSRGVCAQSCNFAAETGAYFKVEAVKASEGSRLQQNYSDDWYKQIAKGRRKMIRLLLLSSKLQNRNLVGFTGALGSAPQGSPIRGV